MNADFDAGNLDFSHISGLSYIAVCHPQGLGVDIIQSETGQTVQTIEIDGVVEISWSANSSHLAILIHTKEARSLNKIVGQTHSSSSSSVLVSDASFGMTHPGPDSSANGEKYEIRVYACSDLSTSEPQEWFLWRTVPAPLYSTDFKSKFGYSHISFSFPLLTLSVDLSTTNENIKNKMNCSKQKAFPDRGWSSQRSKVVLLDVNVCVFDEVILFLPDSDNIPIGSQGKTIIIHTLSGRVNYLISLFEYDTLLTCYCLPYPLTLIFAALSAAVSEVFINDRVYSTICFFLFLFLPSSTLISPLSVSDTVRSHSQQSGYGKSTGISIIERIFTLVLCRVRINYSVIKRAAFSKFIPISHAYSYIIGCD